MKTAKRFISVLLALVLMLGLCSPAFASNEKPYKYLAIGDSTCNGYNSDEYSYRGMSGLNCGDNPGIYPNLMGEYLKEALGCEVEVECILPEGIRAHDLRAVLDPGYSGDQYCRDHIAKWSDRYGDYESLHKTFCDAIADADLISIDVCMSSLGNYFSDRVKTAIGSTTDKSYEEFFGNDLLSSYAEGKYAGIIKAVTACRGEATKLLESFGLPMETVTKIIDAYEYSTGTLMINFTESVKRIYALNDDVQLIVISPFITSCYDLTLEFSDVVFSLSSLLHLYISTVYDYIINLDPNHGRYKLADMYHTVLRCYSDAIADGEWGRYQYVAEDIRRILLGYDVPVDINVPEQDNYFRETVCGNVEKALADTRFDLSFTSITTSDIIKLVTDLLMGGSDIVNSLVKAAAADYNNATETERLALRMVLVFQSWGCHPDYSGHQQKFEAMRKVFEKPFTAKYTYLTSAIDTCESLISTIKSGGSLLGFVSDLIKTSRISIITPRLFR